MRKFKMKARSGFTLIELLVVIAIIAILIGVSIFGIQGARSSSRDAKRKTDLESVRSAIEMYKADNGSYPNTVEVVGDDEWKNFKNDNWFTQAIVPNYISEIPLDTMDNNGNVRCSTDSYGYHYRTEDEGITYEIIAGLETQKTTNCPDGYCGGTVNPGCYLVTNP